MQSWKTGVNSGWKDFAFLSEMGNLCVMCDLFQAWYHSLKMNEQK